MTVLFFDNAGRVWDGNVQIGSVVDSTQVFALADRFRGTDFQVTWPVVNGQDGHYYASAFLSAIDLFGEPPGCKHESWTYTAEVTADEEWTVQSVEVDDGVLTVELGTKQETTYISEDCRRLTCDECNADGMEIFGATRMETS